MKKSSMDFYTTAEATATDPSTTTNLQSAKSQTCHQGEATPDPETSTANPLLYDPNLDLLRMTEVAAIIQCDPATAYRMAASQLFPSVRLGRLIRVRRRDLSAFIQANITPACKHGGLK